MDFKLPQLFKDLVDFLWIHCFVAENAEEKDLGHLGSENPQQ